MVFFQIKNLFEKETFERKRQKDISKESSLQIEAQSSTANPAAHSDGVGVKGNAGHTINTTEKQENQTTTSVKNSCFLGHQKQADVCASPQAAKRQQINALGSHSAECVLANLSVKECAYPT